MKFIYALSIFVTIASAAKFRKFSIFFFQINPFPFNCEFIHEYFCITAMNFKFDLNVK